MSRRDDIIRRANLEYEEALHRRDALRAELLAQQKTELARVPEAQPAVDAYDTALAEAMETYQLKLAKLEAEVLTTEFDAIAVQNEQEAAAMAAWRAAGDKANATRQSAIDAAEAAFNAASTAAMQLVGSARDKAVAAARAKRDAAFQAAEDKYRRDTDSAFDDYTEDSTAARERAIARIEAVRQKEKEGGLKAAEGLQFDQEKAAKTFRSAVALLPQALAIYETFQARLAECDARCEREKADIIARMKRDLAELA